jgi:hypothetical protein
VLVDERISKLFEGAGSIRELGLIVERRCDGELVANVEHVRAHSKSLECGYAGSGPADLALSALNALFPPQGGGSVDDAPAALTRGKGQGSGVNGAAAGGRDSLGATVRLGWEGLEVSQLAWQLHHDFEAAFLVPMDEAGGWVETALMLTWVSERLKERGLSEPEGGTS